MPTLCVFPWNIALIYMLRLPATYPSTRGFAVVRVVATPEKLRRRDRVLGGTFEKSRSRVIIEHTARSVCVWGERLNVARNVRSADCGEK